MIDILVSDLYSEPIDYISSQKNCFQSGTYYFTNDYKNGKIILDRASYYEPNSFPVDDKFMVCEEYYNGIMDDTQKKLLVDGNINSFMDNLPITEGVTDVFVRDSNNRKNVFRINNPYNTQNDIPTPSDIYQLIQVDMIRKISVENLRETPFDIENKDITYLYIINKIFIEYLAKTKYDVANMDFGYPANMKVSDVPKKLLWLGYDVAKNIIHNHSLYDFYCMCILTFRQRNLKSNVYLTENILEKHNKICDLIKSICDDPMNNITTPSYRPSKNI